MTTIPVPTTSGETLDIDGCPVLRTSVRMMWETTDNYGQARSLWFGVESDGEPFFWVQTTHGALTACDYFDDPFPFAVFLAKIVDNDESVKTLYKRVKAGAQRLTSAIALLRVERGDGGGEAFAWWTKMTESAIEQAKRKGYWAFLGAFAQAAELEDDEILDVHQTWREFSHRLENYQCRLIEDGGARAGAKYGRELYRQVS